MKALKIIGIVVGSVVALVIIAAAVIWILMSRSTGAVSQVTPVVSTTEATKDLNAMSHSIGTASQVTPVVSTHEAVEDLNVNWDSFKNTVKQAKPGTQITTTLTQAEVVTQINEELKNVDLPAGT